MADKITPNNTKSLVPTAYYEMLYLRFMGLTYEQIADKTNYSHSHVKLLFSKNGVLHDLYRQWVDTAKKNSVEEAIDMMFGHLPDIIRSRIVLAKSLGMGSNEAAKMILGYTLGNTDRPMVQNNIQINNVQIPQERRDLILNAFKNFGILENETNITDTKPQDSNGNNSGQRSENPGI